MKPGDDWIRSYRSTPDSPGRAVFFPHAGGAASFYFPFAAPLAPIDTLAVQYPGRQDRRAEPPAASIAELADHAAAALAGWNDRPLLLFGHSMGALVAYEVALRLERAGTVPAALVVSSRWAPSHRRVEPVDPDDSDEGVLARMRALSGTDERLLGSPDLLSLILPAVRADFRALRSYCAEPTPRNRVSCPISALIGTADPMAGPGEVAVWERFGTGGFDLRVIEGGHFHLSERPETVVEVVKGYLM